MHDLTFRDDDLRLVYLATVYHLGRPGSESDAGTLAPHTRGLGPVRDELEPQIGRAVATVELSDYQLARLGQALHGVANELKQYEMAQRRSAVPGFSEAMQRLFPGEQDPGAALDLVEQAVMLRRRLDGAVAAAESAVEAAREQQAAAARSGRRAWWQVWKVWQR